MFKNLLDMNDFGTYDIVVTIAFFLIFVGVVIRVAFLKKSYTSHMEHLPLDLNDLTISENKEQTSNG